MSFREYWNDLTDSEREGIVLGDPAMEHPSNAALVEKIAASDFPTNDKVMAEMLIALMERAGIDFERMAEIECKNA